VGNRTCEAGDRPIVPEDLAEDLAVEGRLAITERLGPPRQPPGPPRPFTPVTPRVKAEDCPLVKALVETFAGNRSHAACETFTMLRNLALEATRAGRVEVVGPAPLLSGRTAKVKFKRSLFAAGEFREIDQVAEVPVEVAEEMEPDQVVEVLDEAEVLQPA
jgi:hypothetical protein